MNNEQPSSKLTVHQCSCCPSGNRAVNCSVLCNNKPQVGVGVGVIIKRSGKVLMGKRKGNHGSGTWATPGGHIDFGETVKQCAIRETLEECGIKIKNLKNVPFTEDIFASTNKHYITLWIVADYESGEAEVLEPELCERWEWFDWNNLPAPLFTSTGNMVKSGLNPFDS